MSETVRIPMRVQMLPANNGQLERIQAIFIEELRQAVTDCLLHVQERVKGLIADDNLVYTSHLLNSIAFALGMGENLITGHVGTNLPYAKYPEYGTVPHFVPFNLAPSLYEEMQRKFGWVIPDRRRSENRALMRGPNPAAKKGPQGLSTITGKRATYLMAHPDRLWLQKDRNSRPVWGVFVSGRKRPFMWPGWEQSVEFISNRLMEGCRRAAERCKGGD